VSTRPVLLIAALLCIAGPAAAVDVFVNGVKVTGALRGQTLDVSKVRFAENGDVYVDAPGYNIEVAGGTPPAAPASAPASSPGSAAASVASAPAAPPTTAPSAAVGEARYWLIINMPATGHYKVQVLANGKPVVDVPANRAQLVVDVSTHVQVGANAVTFNFLPLPGAPAVPETVAVDIMLGHGQTGADGTLTISKVLGSFKHPTGRLSAEQQAIRFELAQ
jgi:hypothetical protein